MLTILIPFSSCVHLSVVSDTPVSEIRKATIKITTTSIRPVAYIPWKMNEHEITTGSGAIIRGNLILTNAHVVSDATFIEVEKENDPGKYRAFVRYISHQCDLALLEVDGKIAGRFFSGTTSLELSGDIPGLKSTVATFGYPNGGDRISITEGVISRLEVGHYVHSMQSALLKMQTDAALNPGNSGGPVIRNGKIAGIAFQTIQSAENVGYMIPVPVIRHFLEDIEDGTCDGFPGLGIYWDELLNPDYRRYLGMDDRMSGIVVNKVLRDMSADTWLEAGDVILAIDGTDIANDGSIAFEGGRIPFSFLISKRQPGDTVTMNLLRDKKEMTLSFPLDIETGRIVWYNEYETLPKYYIFGGIVFQVLSLEFLKSWKDWWYNADPLFLYYYMYHDIDDLKPERKEFVIINQILPDEANTYISSVSLAVVDTINGRAIGCLEDVIDAFTRPEGDYHVIVLDNDRPPLVLAAALMKNANERIMQKYGIPSDRRLDEYSGYGRR
ncbi:MAG: trypsin-like peptidase domain-containing protein [Spirochaetales bacterium]|nr:trypsin-like peptidase domain-containing protein [Spirochaetales bacterium]